MAHVQWCVGNTTLREAARLKDGLRVLKEHFNGKPWSYENQKRFLELLQQKGIYGVTEAKSDKQIEQHGRIWSSAFNELGFATCYKKGSKHVPAGVQVTKAGEALLSDSYVEEDVWLRQLLKVQFPNSLPQKSISQYPGFNLLPFQATLKIIKQCDGVSKDEGFIINTLKTMADVDEAIKLIQNHRKGLDLIRKEGRDAIRRYITQQQFNMAKDLYRDEVKERLKYIKTYYRSKDNAEDRKLLQEIVKGGKGSKTSGAFRLADNIKELKNTSSPLKEIEVRFLFYFLTMKSNAWRDYIDAAARYFRMSGILTVHRSKISIAEAHRDIADWVLSQDWKIKKNEDYLGYLHDHTLPILPQDKVDYLKNKTDKVFDEVMHLSKSAKIEVKPRIDKEITDPLLLRRQLLNLIGTKRELKEYEYMLSLHQEKDAVDNIVDYFDSINRKEILGYRPTHFEWNVWRGFLVIDKLIKLPHECRNFDIDDDLQPRNFAPGGKPDMVFYYKDYVLVVEVTLSTGETQYNTEHEPVPRHVVRIIEQEKGKEVYSLFIAPQIHINTAIHFYAKMTAVPYINSNGERFYPKIIPLTLDDYTLLLRIFQEKRYLPEQLKELLKNIVELKEEPKISDGSHWITRIRGCIEKWAEKL